MAENPNPGYRAGSMAGLPFLLLGWLVVTTFTLAAADIQPLQFRRFNSTCIDLAHYDQKARKLTVRYTGKKADHFYRYANVSPKTWQKLRSLNETGGVGKFMNETLVAKPKEHPYEEVTLADFKVIPENRKAGHSKE